MTDNDFLGDRRRAQEEEYFRKQEQVLIAKLQQRRRDETTRGRLAANSGVADLEILRDLATLGYTPETVMLLHLVPLLQVAWAEGGVSARERDLIVRAARARGVEAGSAADSQLTTWLATRPSADFFDGTLRVIGAILQSRPPGERETSRQDLLSYCTAIASASGGILSPARALKRTRAMTSTMTTSASNSPEMASSSQKRFVMGIGNVSPEERYVLARISHELEQERGPDARTVPGSGRP